VRGAVLVVLAACAVESDAERYRAILKDRRSSTGHRFEACGGIGDATLRVDCHVAVLHSVQEPLEPWCSRV
jgi:hypothetical protein